MIQLVPQHGPPIELKPGSTILGRGSFGIQDRRVSRRHAELIVSKETNTISLQSIGVNPSFLTRKGQQNEIVVKKGSVQVLNNGDKISLLQGCESFTLQIDEDTQDKTEPEIDFDQDATQPNMDFNYDDFVKSPLPSPVKRPREEKKGAKGGVTKKARYDDFPGLSVDDSLDSQNSELSAEMPGLRGVKINPEELQLLRLVGTGSCGEVYEALWKGTRVAVKKVFKSMLHGDSLKEFKAETHILRRLRHPNVVLFMGTCTMGRNEMCIVTDFMARGSLHDVLVDDKVDLGWDLLLKMASDAAQGMNYLHTFTPPIIHRDLKSHNLLVDENFCVKVTDFGLAKAMSTETAKTFCGTMPWTAPEIFKSDGYTTKADVYSYGIVLWELITRAEPYEGMHKPQIIVGVSKEGLRPTIPPSCPEDYASLMQDCWDEDPNKRPVFALIIERLRTMQPPRPVMGPQVPCPLSANALTEKFKHSTEVPLLHNWEIEASELEFSKEIGQGASAHVFLGKYRGQQVAIKVLKETGKIMEEFRKELEIMSEIRSPKVLFFYGAVLTPQLCIVTEYLPRGSLYDVMNKKEVKFDWKFCMRLAKAAAESMHVLHCWKPPIVHRDLKSPNLLLDKDWNVKVADFGLARFKTAKNEASLAQLRGTYVYAAPETYMGGQQYTTKSDVYSYSLILWELVIRVITGTYMRPYSEYKNLIFDFQIIIQTAKKGLRPTIPEQCPKPLRNMIAQCWDADPSKRPEFVDILKQLKEVKQQLLKIVGEEEGGGEKNKEEEEGEKEKEKESEKEKEKKKESQEEGKKKKRAKKGDEEEEEEEEEQGTGME